MSSETDHETDPEEFSPAEPMEEVWETQFQYCDVCGHQSYFVVTLSAGKLYFCYHHFNKNKEAHYEAAEDIIDESKLLLVR
jgi:hypothetical protein